MPTKCKQKFRNLISEVSEQRKTKRRKDSSRPDNYKSCVTLDNFQKFS